MKIKITYKTDQELNTVTKLLKPILKGAKVHKKRLKVNTEGQATEVKQANISNINVDEC